MNPLSKSKPPTRVIEWRLWQYGLADFDLADMANGGQYGAVP